MYTIDSYNDKAMRCKQNAEEFTSERASFYTSFIELSRPEYRTPDNNAISRFLVARSSLLNWFNTSWPHAHAITWISSIDPAKKL